jgi:hypothetical protein
MMRISGFPHNEEVLIWGPPIRNFTALKFQFLSVFIVSPVIYRYLRPGEKRGAG